MFLSYKRERPVTWTSLKAVAKKGGNFGFSQWNSTKYCPKLTYWI